jgi:hypothetical protein
MLVMGPEPILCTSCTIYLWFAHRRKLGGVQGGASALYISEFFFGY